MSLLGAIELDCGPGTTLLGTADPCVGVSRNAYFDHYIDTPELQTFGDVSPKAVYFDGYIDTPELQTFGEVNPKVAYFDDYIDTPDEVHAFLEVTPGGFFDDYIDTPDEMRAFSDVSPGLFFDGYIDTPDLHAFIDTFPDQNPVIRITEAVASTEGTITLHPFLTLREKARMSDLTAGGAKVALAIAEGVTLRDLYALLFSVTLEEQVEGEASILPTIRALLSFAEGVRVLQAITTRVHAIQVVAEMASVSARTGATLFLQLFEALDLEDATDFERVTVLLSILEQCEAQDLIPDSIYLTLPPISEQIEAEDGLSLSARLTLALEEGIVVLGGLNLGGAVYEAWAIKANQAWVLNTETFGSWQYDNYPFTGFTECQGKFFGVKEDGVYLLDGDTDAGVDIEAVVTTGLSDLGTRHLKHVTRAYLLLSNSGEMALQVFSTDGAKKTTNHYLLDPTEYEAPENKRVKLQRGVRAVLFGAELRNIDGADFSLHGWDVYAVKLRRKI